MNLLEKPLPSDDALEQALLASTLTDPRNYERMAKYLDAGDWYSPYNRRVYDAMTKLYSEDRPINPITIAEVWKSEGVELENTGGVSRITNLTLGAVYLGPKDFEDGVQKIKAYSVARQMILTCNATIENLLIGSEPIKDVVERSENKVLTLSSSLVNESADQKAFSELWEITPDMAKQFQDYHAGISNGVGTGMHEVDDMLDGGGLQAGGLYLIAAGEKTGKTSMALDWCDYISGELGKKSLIITGEMSKITMAKRLYSANAGIPYYRFRPGMYDMPDDPTYTRAMQGLDKFGRIPIAIADKLHHVGQIKRHCRREVERGHKSNDPSKKVAVIVIDYLQLFTLDPGYGKVTRTEEVEKVSREFKLLATELDVPIIAISSLNRIGLTDGQVPDTFNLRQAGTLAFDAEAIWFLHNPAYVPGQPYTPTPVTPMNFILSRQRNGPTGTIPVMFIGPYMQFMTVADYERRRGPTNTDNPVPLSAGQERQQREDLNKLWE